MQAITPSLPPSAIHWHTHRRDVKLLGAAGSEASTGEAQSKAPALAQ